MWQPVLGISLLTLLSGCASPLGDKSDIYYKNQGLHEEMDHRLAQRNDLRGQMAGANPETQKELQAQIDTLNSEVRALRRKIGYPEGDPSSIQPTNTEVDTRKVLTVIRPAWDGLTDGERTALYKSYLIAVREPDSFAVIVDAQGVNESDPGTNGGAIVGSSLASAAYIDRAFKPGNSYSAVGGLAIGLVGAIVGGSMDRPASKQCRFRYALRKSDGNIQYAEDVSSSPFRHAIGVCLELPHLSMVDPSMCDQNTEALRSKYLPKQG